MKKAVYLLMCSSLLVIGGCTFNQRNHPLSQDNTKVSEKKTGTELMNENEGVGVIDFLIVHLKQFYMEFQEVMSIKILRLKQYT